MRFHATDIIADYFEEKELKFHVRESDDSSFVAAGFGVPCGPSVMCQFISNDNGNDVAVRIYGIVNELPGEKETAMLRELNAINAECRFAKFYLDDERTVNMEMDIPVEIADGQLGAVCFECFCRMAAILRGEYHRIASVIYSDGCKPEP